MCLTSFIYHNVLRFIYIVSVFHSFLWLNDIHLLSHLSFDKHFGGFHLLAIVNNGATNMFYVHMFHSMFLVLLRYTPKTGTVRSYGNSMINCLRNCPTFPHWLNQFTSLPAKYEGSNFFTSSSSLVIFIYNYDYDCCYSHPSECEVMPHHGSDLHFPYDKCCRIHFHVFLDLCIAFLEKYLFKSFAHFLKNKWVICLFVVVL